MKKFELFAVKESRALIALLFTCFSIPGSIYLISNIQMFVWKAIILIFVIFLIWLFIYASYGKLSIISNEDTLRFEWDKKLVFGYNKFPEIKLKDIGTIVVDEIGKSGVKSIRKIVTPSKTIHIGNPKFLRMDADIFFHFLMLKTKAKILDSWDFWNEKGLLKIAYKITTIILISVPLFLIGLIFTKDSNHFPVLVLIILSGSYFQMVRFWLMMRNKNKK